MLTVIVAVLLINVLKVQVFFSEFSEELLLKLSFFVPFIWC